MKGMRAVGAVCLGYALVGCSPKDTSVGSAAADFLSADPYSKLQIEYDSVEGRKLDPRARDVVLATLDAMVDKPGGTAIDTTETLEDGDDPSWNLESLRAYEAEHRSYHTEGDTIALYVLIVDGHFHSDTASSVRLAMAYGPTSMVVFADTVNTNCNAVVAFETDPAIIEGFCPGMQAASLLHELGHLMGLVNVGTEMVSDHADEEHRGHDSNPGCLMHWSNEQATVADFIYQYVEDGTEGVEFFDQACQADLEAARNQE